MARVKLFDRLPEIWGRLDTQGVLERYLDIWDIELDWVKDLADSLMLLRDVDRVPDKYIKLLTTLVGHEWRDDKSYPWNRRRGKHSVRRYSYKGTIARLSDDLADAGAESYELTDMASNLLVWSRQGNWGEDNAHFCTADYWHDGAFDLRIITDDDTDVAAFITDFEDTKQAGTVWWLKSVHRIDAPDAIFEANWTWKHSPSLRSQDIDRSYAGYGGVWGGFDWSYDGQMEPVFRNTEYRYQIMEAPVSADSTLHVSYEIPIGLLCEAMYAPMQLNPVLTDYEA